MAEYDKVLGDLVSRTNRVASQGTQKERELYDDTLRSLASATNTDPLTRQAALQIRLNGKADVSRSSEGTLSFSAPRKQTGLTQEAAEAFTSKPTTFGSEAVIIGDSNNIVALGATATASPTELTIVGEAASSPALKGIAVQLASVNEITDPVERRRSLLNMSEAINTARARRVTELQISKARELGVPELKAELAQQEKLDRQSPEWSIYQTDSTETAGVRARLRQAENDAYVQAQRAIETDATLVAFDAEVKRTEALATLDYQQLQQAKQDERANKGTQSERDRELLYLNLGLDGQQRVAKAYEVVHGKAAESSTDLVNFYATNDIAKIAPTADVRTLTVQAANPMVAKPQRDKLIGFMTAIGVDDAPGFVEDYRAMSNIYNKLSVDKDGNLKLDKLTREEREAVQNSGVSNVLASLKSQEFTQMATGSTLSKEQKAQQSAEQAYRLVEIVAQYRAADEIAEAKDAPVSGSTGNAQVDGVVGRALDESLTYAQLLNSSHLRGLVGETPAATRANIEQLADLMVGNMQPRVKSVLPGHSPLKAERQNLIQQLQLKVAGLNQVYSVLDPNRLSASMY